MAEILVGSIQYVLWVLLPLIPAILIFWIFPDTKIEVGGPLNGLSVKASGAIGAYILVFAAIGAPILRTGSDLMTNLHHHFWTVQGHIKLFDGKVHDEGHEIKGERREIIVTTTPQPYRLDGNLFIGSLAEDAAKRLPDINISIKGFEPKTVDLNDPKLERDDTHKLIVIDLIPVDREGALLPNADVSTKLDAAPINQRNGVHQ